MIENDDVVLDDATLVAFQATSARRRLIDEQDELVSLATGPARRVAAPISFEPEEPLATTLVLPKVLATKPIKPAQRDSIKLRRGLLGVAAAATASAAFIMPSALSTVTAQPALPTTTVSDAEARELAVTRSTERPELAAPLTEAEVEAIAEAARVAEEQRLAAEAAAAAAAAEAARIAEEERLAAEAAAAEAARIAEEERLAAEAAAAAAAIQTPAPISNNPGNSGGGAAAPAAPPVSNGYCAYGNGSGLGLTYQAQAAFQAICAQFPGVSSYGGWRPSGDDHGAGQAIDIMISGPAGWDIANWLVANSSWLSVEYVIYEQQIWGRWAPGSGFTWMENRGSVTANHYDHVHVTIR